MNLEDDVKFEEANKNTSDYRCPSCGAPVKYSPEKGVLMCDYCNTEVEVEKILSRVEFDLDEGKLDDSSWSHETKIIHCDNCGANNVYNSNEISMTCPFCGSNQVVETNELAGIKPHRVIPFKQSNLNINENYHNWLKKKFFAPRKIKKEIPNLIINGVYLPIWTFDSDTMSFYSGKLGKRYTRTVGSGKNRRTVTEIRYFHVSGSRAVKFDDLIINAGSKISQEEINQIAPFDTNNSFDYESGFLAGYSSEHYVLRLNKGWDNAKVKMDPVIRREILRRYNYDVVSYLNVNTSYNNVKYKYVLIPIWIGLYKYNNKNFRFIANGETGKVTGKAPVSPVKVTIVSFLSIILALLLILWIMNS